MPEKWPGVGARIGQRLREIGYRRPDGRPDVMRFARERRYVHTYIHKYLKDTTTPDRTMLLRLSTDLKCHPAWLLFGDQVRPFLRVILVALLGTSLLTLHEPAHARSVQVDITNASYRKYLRALFALLSGFPRIDSAPAAA